jgi:hypothetical protein
MLRHFDRHHRIEGFRLPYQYSLVLPFPTRPNSSAGPGNYDPAP